MRRHVVVALATASAVLASVTPALAQSWRADIGVNGGGSWYSNMLGSDKFGGNGDPIRFKPSYLVGGQLGFWFTPRIGIRANMTYVDDKLSQGSDNTLYGDVNLWSGTGDLMIRLKTPAATMTKMEALPYIALGVGKKWINPAADLFTATVSGDSKTGVPFVCGAGIVGFNNGTCVGPAAGGGSNFFLTETSRIMGLVGLGTDLRMARNFALRLEIGDRLYKPELWQVNAPAAGTFTTPPGYVRNPALVSGSSTDNMAKLVNEIYGQIGLHMLLGVAAPPVVAVTPTPAPPPPPPPPPAAPTTQDVSVCVVDPTAAGGLTMTTAQFNPTTGDTTVMVNGTATKFSTTVGNVPVASNAQWYVQGQPLTIGTGRNSLAYVSFGTARNIASTDLTYLGTVNGLPVYASKSDVASLTIPTPPAEIGTDKTMITGLRNVQVLYVPVSSYGCNFQPIQMQQAVRKVRG